MARLLAALAIAASLPRCRALSLHNEERTVKTQAPRPHVVLFVMDDQGWANVGYNNAEHVITPNMDALAKQGMKLTRHYAASWCTPSRASLMTGRLPHHVVEETDDREVTTKDLTMLPAKLRQAGYATHQVGKWDLGKREQWMIPVERGFDTSYGFLGHTEDHFTHEIQPTQMYEWGCDAPGPYYDFWANRSPIYGVEGTYGEFLYNAEIARIINDHSPSRPLFMYVAPHAMHGPIQVPEAYSNMYKEKGYDDAYAEAQGMVSIADELLGNLTAALRAKGMWDNTLILVTSDNGGPTCADQNSGNNWPLRGGKKTSFEGGIRVPTFLSGGFVGRWPGKTLDGMMHMSDWYPTLCGLGGVDAADDGSTDVPGIDGLDMWPYISGDESSSPRTEIMLGTATVDHSLLQVDGSSSTRSKISNSGIIVGEWKLILGWQLGGIWTAPHYPNSSSYFPTHDGIECGLGHVDCAAGCLFNIRNDPSEYHDRAKEQPEKLAELQELFQNRSSTKFQNLKFQPPDKSKCNSFAQGHSGFVGPYLY